MATLDLRRVSTLNIQVLFNEAWNFTLTLTGASTLIGATATMTISRYLNSTPVQSLSVGGGLTITALDKIAINPANLLTVGDYVYDLEITTLSGEVYRIKGRISATYE